MDGILFAKMDHVFSKNKTLKSCRKMKKKLEKSGKSQGILSVQKSANHDYYLKEHGKHCVFFWWSRRYVIPSQQNENSSLSDHYLHCVNPAVVQVFCAFPQNVKPTSKTVKNRVDRCDVERYNAERCPVWYSARIHRLALHYKKKRVLVFLHQ